MNKIIVILFATLILFSGAYFYLQRTTLDTDTPAFPTPTQAQTQETEETRSFEPSEQINGYQVKSLLIRDPAYIHLYSNLTDRLPTPDAMAKNNCTDLVTGGFYTESFDHIGLLISDFEVVSQSRPALNSSAYFSINSQNIPTISLTIPQGPRLAVQSYPVLMVDGEMRSITTASNDKARRIVVVTTDKNEVMFIVVYESSAVFGGPTLNELPGIIADYQENENIKFRHALNLDGGTHSAFISRFINLPEISTVGSYFCMRY